MARLQEKYTKEIVGKLKEKLGRTNVLSLPRLQKICVNMGVGKALQDKNRMEQAADNLTQIAGQKCQVTKARIAVEMIRTLIEDAREPCEFTREAIFDGLELLVEHLVEADAWRARAREARRA